MWLLYFTRRGRSWSALSSSNLCIGEICFMEATLPRSTPSQFINPCGSSSRFGFCDDTHLHLLPRFEHLAMEDYHILCSGQTWYSSMSDLCALYSQKCPFMPSRTKMVVDPRIQSQSLKESRPSTTNIIT